MRSLVQRMVEMKSLLKDSRGATMVEYALMVALIAAVVATAVSGVATNLSSEFGKIAKLLP